MPTTTDGTLEITPVLKPLEPFRDRITVYGNMTRAGGRNATDHAVSSAGWLSGVVAKQTEAEDISLGVTLDQVLARQVGQDTPFPSLEFATEDFAGYIGGCVPGYSCTYMNTISWAGETSPLPMEINPRVAFERMFGRAGDPAARITRMKENRSILDSIGDEARALQRKVTPTDRVRLDAYLDNVREIERRIQRTESRNASDVLLPRADRHPRDVRGARGADVRAAGGGVRGRHDARLHLHDGARSERPDVPRPRHRRSASRRVAPRPGRRPRWRCTPRSTRTSPTCSPTSSSASARRPEGDGSVLDHSLIMYGTGMSDGQAHNDYPLPIAVVGGGKGIRGNRFVIAKDRTPLANLLLGVAGTFGSRLETFGESTARMEV